jgi:hypothetical protein
MSITTAICNSFKQEVLQGVHTSSDTYKMALFTSAASLDKNTTAYAATNEASGTGYTAGGLTMTGYTTALDGDVAYIDFTTDPQWTSATITAAGALIYNSSKSNKAVAVFAFGGDVSSTAGNFTVQLPAASGSTALIRLS